MLAHCQARLHLVEGRGMVSRVRRNGSRKVKFTRNALRAESELSCET